MENQREAILAMDSITQKKSRIRLLFRAALGLFVFGGMAITGAVYYISNPTNEQLSVVSPLTAQSSPLSSVYLSSAEYAADYKELTEGFKTQIYRSYCGVASSVTVLNALDIRVNQRDFFSESASQTRSLLRTFLTGMPLRDLSGLLEAHGAEVETYYGSQITLTEFRQILQQNLANPNDFVIVNYSRETVGQKPGGHISPIAAYDRAQDQALVLDVASFKYPPVWIPLGVLFDSINTIDSETGRSRGLVTVRKPEKA